MLAHCLLQPVCAGKRTEIDRRYGGRSGQPVLRADHQRRGLEARKLAGDSVKVTLVSSGYDLGQQVSQIDNFIAAKVDMIILNAADSKGIGPAVKRAKDAGIVVVAVDVAAEGADATITSDNTRRVKWPVNTLPTV